jgi:hypothetical protein
MDHEAVPRLCKICDWLLNSSQDHFGLHQGKKCQSDHEVQGPQKTYFKAYIIHGHVLQWERQKNVLQQEKRQGPMVLEKCFYNECFLGEKKTKTKEDKRMVKPNFFFSSKLPFDYKKKQFRSSRVPTEFC